MSMTYNSFRKDSVGVLFWSCLLLTGMTARAELNITPGISARYEQNSNVFATNEAQPLQDSNGALRLDDNYAYYGASLDSDYLWGVNRLYLNSQYRRFQYDNFRSLDRNEYAVLSGLQLVANTRWSGGLTGRYERLAVPFEEVAFVQGGTPIRLPYLRIDREYGASARYQAPSNWQADTSVTRLASSLPNYRVHQTDGRIALSYISGARLTAGVAMDVTKGSYPDVVVSPEFDQTQYQLTADYRLGGRSTIAATVGHAQREQPGFRISAGTGSVLFSQTLTAKTNYYLQYSRNITGYVTSQGSQLDDTAQVGVIWQASPKIALDTTYSYTRSDVDGEFNVVAGLDHREDRTHNYTAMITYDPLRWMSIRPYLRHQQRKSTLNSFTFDAEVYGVELLVRYQ